jgi:hypothetical protein
MSPVAVSGDDLVADAELAARGKSLGITTGHDGQDESLQLISGALCRFVAGVAATLREREVVQQAGVRDYPGVGREH